jgi:hypothetical protein
MPLKSEIMLLAAKLCHLNLSKFYRLPENFCNNFTVYPVKSLERFPVYPVYPSYMLYRVYRFWFCCNYATIMLLLCHYYATTMPLLCHLRLIMPLNSQKGSYYATHYASIVQNPHRAKICQAYAGRIAKWQAVCCVLCAVRLGGTNSQLTTVCGQRSTVYGLRSTV